MALITWHNGLSVGIRQFDVEHMKMIEIINTLDQAMRDGKGNDILGRILDELADYTRTHFETEEQVMKQHGYPEYASHKKQHDKLVLEVAKTVRNFHMGNAPLPENVMQFLVEWLTRHINGEDKAYGPFLTGKGVV